LEKGLGKADKEALKNFYASVSSGTTLVPEGDKRPPISAQVTATDFEIVGNEAAPKQLTADNLFQ
jgi:predicted ATP-dependent Lon-type protease